MIILITDVTDAEIPYQSIDIVTFKVVDGTPSIEEVTQLLNRELDISSLLTKNQARTINDSRTNLRKRRTF